MSIYVGNTRFDLGFIVIRHILDFTAELVYEIGNDSLRHHVSSFKVNLFLPRLVVCRQPPSAAVWSQINYVGQLGILF